MKTIRKIMALALVLCMAAAMGVWNTDAHADWYTVQFNKLDNRTFEDIPTGVTLTTAAAPASAADTPASATAGAAADPQKPGQLEWFYNPWAGTLVIRGRGAMVGFDEKHPAPWHNESKRALRVIIDEGVTTISNEAFKDFIYLRSVVFPSTLKGISATAFEKCEKLKRVEVVTEIKDAEKLIEASKSKELLMDD
ncbi:MAG: leucine-rich repeat protein, partial [Oscillospiraceae bacterium]|nr:leucine-rich repeat protein [Oscillospiraceae bacterium]